MKLLWMRSIISICAVGIAAAHVNWPEASIDGITVTLLLVALLPWLQPLFKSLELPGGVKVEFQDLDNVAKLADSAGLLAPAKPPDQSPAYSFLQVAASDPNLALAGLRIELERRLRHLLQSRGATEVPQSIGELLRDLNRRELIGGAERAILSDLVTLLNSAVHGADVTLEAADWALDIGPRILGALEERTASTEIRYKGIVPGE